MAISAQTKVLTLDWWKPASKLTKGDYVFDRNGKVVQVTLVQEYYREQCYEVTFSDYLTVSGDDKLGFPIEDLKYRKRLDEYKGLFKFTRPLKHLTVDNLLELPLKSDRDRLNYSVPTTQPLQLPHQDLPVPPFVFGFWFFNRKSNHVFNAPSGKHDEVAERLKDYGYKIRTGRKRPGGRVEFTTSPTVESQLVPNIPNRITQNYLLASPEQRLDLLSGIVLSKSAQYNPKTDRFRITSLNLPTITRIQMLAESLGIKTSIENNEKLGNFSLFFRTKHKLQGNQRSPDLKVHHARRFITQITKIPAQTCIYIETSAPDNTILVGEGFIPCR
jgi:hypothetical protein